MLPSHSAGFLHPVHRDREPIVGAQVHPPLFTIDRSDARQDGRQRPAIGPEGNGCGTSRRLQVLQVLPESRRYGLTAAHDLYTKDKEAEAQISPTLVQVVFRGVIPAAP